MVGADLSITSTALALINEGDVGMLFNYKTKGKRTDGYPEWCERINDVSYHVLAQLGRWKGLGAIDLLVIESPSHGSKFGNPHERAGLWWDVYRWAYGKSIPVVTVAPTTRAKYLTGDGRADKKTVLAAARATYGDALNIDIANDDEADAIGLGDMGARFLGEPLVPTLPAKNLETMGVPAWPTSSTAQPVASAA